VPCENVEHPGSAVACQSSESGTVSVTATFAGSAFCSSAYFFYLTTKEFVRELRKRNVTPHVAQNTKNRKSAIDNRTTQHAGYAVSQRKRKRVEEIFGWMKTVAMLRKTRHRGIGRVSWMFTLGVAVYNLVRIRNLMAGPA
jgi:Transposase DDE domain